ncbi:hypothetical protein [Streptomyces bobili]|uniref:hypothetical protein n=1 Tax=Streptomyces bobili TaxID=67280 RepID=UPI003789CF04
MGEPSKCGIYIAADNPESSAESADGGGTGPIKCGIHLEAESAPEGVIAHAGSTGAESAGGDGPDKCGIYIKAE